MDEFVFEQPWFRSMIGAVVHRHVTEMTWWKYMACFGKSMLTATDIGTDIVTGIIYYRAGETNIAAMLFGLAGTSMFIQLMVVAAVHSYDWKIMVREMLWTLTGLRSGLLHKRILTKVENEEAWVGVLTEAFCCKSIEVSVENLPGAVIQFEALTKGGLSGNNLIVLVASFVASCGSVVNNIVNMDIRIDSVSVNRALMG
jgi:hypothetical protein